MLAPSTIVSAFVTKLKAIPALVSAVGDSTRIQGYTNVGDLAYAIQQLPEPSILVAHQSTTPGGVGNREVWLHGVGVVIRSASDPSPIFKAIANSVPTGMSQPIWRGTFDSRLLPCGNFQIFRRQLQFDAGVFLDYYEMTFTFPENGDQNDS